MLRNSLWYDDQLAGSSYTTTLLTRGASHGVDPGFSDYSLHDFQPEFSIPESCVLSGETAMNCPRARLSDYSFRTAVGVLQSHESQSRALLFDSSQPGSSLLAGSPSSSSVEDKLHDISSSCTRGIWSSFRCHQDALSLSGSCHSLSSEATSDSSDSAKSITPKLEERDNQLSSSTGGFPTTLSPYTPLPLQPIFSLESLSKATHSPTGSSLSSCPPFCNVKDDESLPENAMYTPYSPAVSGSVSLPGSVPLSRGSAASGCLWPPLRLWPLQAPTENESSPSQISLEIAKQLAQEHRVVFPNAQLSLPFLLSFMGQSDSSQTSWLCRIQDCRKQLVRKSHMVDHIRMHLDERVYACQNCPQTFLRKADCKRHLAAHNPEKAFRCDLCFKSFGRKDLLTRHKRKCEVNLNNGEGTTKGRTRKKKGMQSNSILNTQAARSALFIAGNRLPMPSRAFKRDFHSDWEYDEANKENTPPFLLQQEFNDGNGMDGSRRKNIREATFRTYHE